MVGPLLAGTVAEYSYFGMFIMMASLIATGGLIVIVLRRNDSLQAGAKPAYDNLLESQE